jgi:two-component system KDP operon response regulator KdpE
MNTHLLLVEDDPVLGPTLVQELSRQGHVITWARSCADARALLQHHPRSIDLVLLDLGLPDGEGAHLLSHIRQQGQTPVVIISARQDDAGKVALLDDGADDYLVKPFNFQELFARVRVALRHRGTQVQQARLHYCSGELCIDLQAHQVRLRGHEVHLTPTEFKLLARLVQQAGQVVTHRALLLDVWGPGHTEQVQYLRLYMGQLRSKLEAIPAEPQWLLTEPGIGYRLSEPLN